MIRINPALAIDDEELDERFIRSSGPGGQHVNKVSTAVQLRWDAAASQLLSESQLERLRRVAGNRMTRDDVLVISARRHRSREQNRREARERLAVLIRRAITEPRPRKRTRPSAAARRQRLDDKRRRGTTKRLRGRVGPDDS